MIVEGIYQGVVGFEFVFDLGSWSNAGVRSNPSFSLESADTLEVDVVKPDGSSVVWSASIKGDPATGYLSYTTVANDLDLVGVYRAQPRIEITSPAAIHRGRVAAFQANQLGV